MNFVSWLIQLIAFLVVIACGVVLIFLKIKRHRQSSPKVIEKTFGKFVYKKCQNNPNKPIVIEIKEKGEVVGSMFVKFVKKEIK